MRELRNPFRWRASENIVGDSTFLRLFGVKALEVLPQDPWSRLMVLRSAPGGGKTTLMRVFTPSALSTLYKNRSNEDYKSLFHMVKSMGIFDDNGPTLLSALLSCNQGYAMLDDLAIDAVLRERLFYSLLNVRIILAVLRGACIIKNFDYPKDLEKFFINIPKDYQYPNWVGVPVPCTGDKLAQWAINIEETICDAIDSFDYNGMPLLKGHDSIFALEILRPEVIEYGGKSLFGHTLIMLDDFHKLTPRQQEKLLDNLISKRWPVGIWIAERIEALSKKEFFSFGATMGRDYEAVTIEEYWRDQKRFENIVSSIADQRISLIPELQTSSFSGMLEASIDESKYNDSYKKASEEISSRIFQNYSSDVRFKDWLEGRKSNLDSTREQAIEWRKLEILIQRKLNDAQLSLPFPYPIEEINSSPIQIPAEYFISREFNIPYYFNLSNLAILGSSNFEQFLDFAGELFEYILPAIVLGRQPSIPAVNQQEILKKVAERRWEEIPRRTPNGYDAVRLLTAVVEFAQTETNRPSAPYAPGVTGIGISERDRSKLLDEDLYEKNPRLRSLCVLLMDCLSNNLLEPRWIHQGQKDQSWMVLYLNRWICLYSNLPLQYGGWRPVKIERLIEWTKEGHIANESKKRLL